jgi:hypothetical protein
MLSAGDLQSDVVFQGFYGARFISAHPLLKVTLRKKFGYLRSANQGGHGSFEMILSCSGAIPTRWEQMPLSAIC